MGEMAECREEAVQGATEFVTAQAKRDHKRNLRRNLEQCRDANLKPFTCKRAKCGPSLRNRRMPSNKTCDKP